ncbi:leucyl aminopeptidase [Marasmius fiardii PR-910]|nr:leucyl aminopeptidase [Marasmius fiardii PR-910]
MSTSSEFRLPTNVKPTHYNLTICTDLEKLVFDGFVEISLDIKENTDKITLNSNALDLGKAHVISDSSKGSPLVETKQIVDDGQKRVTFQFPTELAVDSKAQFQISFSGELKDNMLGYYRSAYEHNGKTRYYALTHFEPTNARRAFPCWDEPQLKATFAITLISKVNTTNVSNMPALHENTFSAEDHSDLKEKFLFLDSEWKVTRYETTPLMSSYIVAFANGDFSHLETYVKMPLSGKTIPLRIYATPDIIHQAQFTLDVKTKVLPIYEKVFDVEYPLPKLDTLVATDFDIGAMENWGLITGRARSFLLDPNSADMTTKKLIVGMESHEVSHMWFGNIATMEWWDYLYLKEGFATLVTLIQYARAFPEFKANSEFINGHLAEALSLDAKISSHPIEVVCPNAEFIGQSRSIFDGLSYSKAGSVLRMLAAHIGTERFLKGVSIYLKNHLYGNSTTRDLWKGISEYTGQDIVTLMDDWITKVGFPVVTVTETDSGIKVRQDRFLEIGIAEGTDNETIWSVPLSILSVDADGKTTIDNTAVLNAREKSYSLDTSKPFKLNSGTNGVYRVLYSEERYQKIARELSKPDSPFSLEDRLGLISDSFALSKAALTKLSDALTLADALRDEKEYLAWSAISAALSGIASVWWEHSEILDYLDAFRRSMFAPLVQRLGYDYSDADSIDTTQLRTCAIDHAVSAGETSVIEELKSRFKYFAETGDDSRIPPDLQRATFIAAVRYGGRTEFDAVKKVFDKPKTPSAKINSIAAMTATEDDNLLKEVMQLVKPSTGKQEVLQFFRGLNRNKKARRLNAVLFRETFDEFFDRFSEITLMYLIESSFSDLTTEKDLNDIIGFFEGKDQSRYSLALAQSLDSIRARIAYIKHSTEDLEKWLKERR